MTDVVHISESTRTTLVQLVGRKVRVLVPTYRSSLSSEWPTIVLSVDGKEFLIVEGEECGVGDVETFRIRADRSRALPEARDAEWKAPAGIEEIHVQTVHIVSSFDSFVDRPVFEVQDSVILRDQSGRAVRIFCSTTMPTWVGARVEVCRLFE